MTNIQYFYSDEIPITLYSAAVWFLYFKSKFKGIFSGIQGNK